MAKSIKGEDGNISTQDFRVMYYDAMERFYDFSHGVALKRADELNLTGLKRVFFLVKESYYTMPQLKKAFNVGCAVRCHLNFRDKPEDLLYKLAYS